MDKEITINISGVPASGKTTLAHEILLYLQSRGFSNVKNLDIDACIIDEEGPSCTEIHEEKLACIQERPVRITTSQIQRCPGQIPKFGAY
jgi:tRNA uridine 5-carbamoylmethylation protein Kti12